jgi:hypothetical protein
MSLTTLFCDDCRTEKHPQCATEGCKCAWCAGERVALKRQRRAMEANGYTPELVSSAAEAEELFDVDELERYAASYATKQDGRQVP